MIERRKQRLLSELTTLNNKRLNEIYSTCCEIERHSETMQGLKKYIDEVVKKGTVCDIVRTARSLDDRTDELLMVDLSEAQLLNDDVSFAPSSDDANKSLGEKTVSTEPYRNTVATTKTHNSATLMRAVTFGGNEVLAVTALDNELFISCADSNYIEVYDTETITLQRRIKIPGLIPCGWSMCGLAACGINKCIYVSHSDSSIVVHCNKIRKIRLSDSQAITAWTVEAEPRGLSVTSSSNNILVACYAAKVLQEYTTHGRLVREIRPRDFNPWHAVELAKDQIIVSNNYCLASVGDLCICDDDNQVMLHIYSQSGALTGALVDPGGIVVTKTGCILVADSGNNRILRMDRTLCNAQQLDLPVDGGLQQPIGLWLDESRGRLYVAEGEGRRLLVFDNVTVV